MDLLAARAADFLAEHTGSGRAVKNQAARRKALLDTQHKKRAEVAARNRGIVAAVLGGHDEAGHAFYELPLQVASSETDVTTELPALDMPIDGEKDEALIRDDPAASLQPIKVDDSAREERLRFVSEFSVPEVCVQRAGLIIV